MCLVKNLFIFTRAGHVSKVAIDSGNCHFEGTKAKRKLRFAISNPFLQNPVAKIGGFFGQKIKKFKFKTACFLLCYKTRHLRRYALLMLRKCNHVKNETCYRKTITGCFHETFSKMMFRMGAKN